MMKINSLLLNNVSFFETNLTIVGSKTYNCYNKDIKVYVHYRQPMFRSRTSY